MPGFQEHIEVRTTRLCLRRLRVQDAEDVHLIRSRLKAMGYSIRGPDTSIEHTQNWIRTESSRSNTHNLGIVLLDPEEDSTSASNNSNRHRVIGLVGAVEAPEIGYVIHPDFWGRGLATEALQTFMPLYWEQFRTKFDFAFAKIDPNNGASKKVLLKCGFNLEETQTIGFENPSLGLTDIDIYRLRRPRPICQ
ncbi:GNAT domain-containing protein [Phyllosticta citribraziliensis]|uniref:GNAT domain-containing protein n=1 Tax=Phyllosticta citribraziliensis TaxID=989973 RepID=A0ABR1LEI1_9PEZI